MVEKKVPPEEKLLKIIENPLNVRQKPLVNLRGKVKKPFSIKSWIEESKKSAKEIKSFVTLRNANKGLAGVCGLLTIFGLFNFFSEDKHFKMRIEGLRKNPVGALKETKERYALSASLSEMLNEARGRNIFSFLPLKTEVPLMPIEVAQTIGNLKLVGILWSDNPQAMIENNQEQKTYLLSAGEQIGQIKIKAILRDSVIIGKDEQEWVLR